MSFIDLDKISKDFERIKKSYNGREVIELTQDLIKLIEHHYIINLDIRNNLNEDKLK